ncbi:MAG: hypothetical protein JSW27_05795 [Phycisphaerales bacterium]|nr:MAG: hypothetical protein JSW27_05795 [Phycisphaerales bacterium]
MRKAGYAILVALVLLTLLGPGCRRSAQTPSRQSAPPVRVALTWGPEIEGLQCRLRPAKRLWNVDASPTFKLDLRNQGKRLFAFDTSEPVRADRIWLDGRWYRWPDDQTGTAQVQPFAPDTELTDLNLILPQASWLPLTPGYHDVAVAFVFEGLDVVSNRVSIGIAD